MSLTKMFKDKLNVSSPSHSAVTGFQYMPLQDDCIRLVHLQPRPRKGNASKIECTLSHVAFGNRPQYDALSYVWGDGITKKTISLNGIGFEVGENLAAALINIRGLESAGETPRALWIDAICINQLDIAERNRQVRLMPYIYARAQMVLVWLGMRGLFDNHCATEGMHRKERPKHHETDGVYHGLIQGHIIVGLCGREYWKRLWIIQEIGKATRLRIHYHSTTMEWDRFIENVNVLGGVAGTTPLRFAAQLRGPYDGGFTLSNLLRTNNRAMCKDPRDKIYGLLGLAVDVDNKFPIDYSKSLFEVFKDTIYLQNGDNTRSQHDILEMSRLVAKILGGPAGLEPDAPARSFDAGDVSLDLTHVGVERLRVSARLLGIINHIGPSHSEMMDRIEKSDEWKSLIMRELADFPLRSTVLEQNDLFLKVLEDFYETSQTTIFGFNRRICRKDREQPAVQTFKINRPSSKADTAAHQSSLNGCRMFLLEPLAHDHDVSWMGLAPLSAQVGDFICEVPGIERAVVVRQSSHKDLGQYIYPDNWMCRTCKR